MSVSLLTPDLRRILDDLARRIGILERRTTRTAPPASPVVNVNVHPGTGDVSVVLEPTGSGADASADGALAMGNGATASGTNSIAVGAAIANQDGAAAYGWGATAGHIHSTAIGTQAGTIRNHQVVLGDATDFVEIPGDGIVLTSPDNTRYLIVVNNGGSLSSSVAP